MTALATVADLEVRTPLPAGSEARAGALLADASALVRGHTRQWLSFVADDVRVIRAIGRVIKLPERPVESVTEVAAIDAGGDVPVSGWMWDGIDKVFLPLQHGSAGGTWRVTYSHGYQPLPDDVVAVVCGMVGRVLTSPSMAEGVTSETIGQYSYQMQQSVGSSGVAVRMLPSDRDALARYRRTAGTIRTPAR